MYGYGSVWTKQLHLWDVHQGYPVWTHSHFHKKWFINYGMIVECRLIIDCRLMIDHMHLQVDSRFIAFWFTQTVQHNRYINVRDEKKFWLTLWWSSYGYNPHFLDHGQECSLAILEALPLPILLGAAPMPNWPTTRHPTSSPCPHPKPRRPLRPILTAAGGLRGRSQLTPQNLRVLRMVIADTGVENVKPGSRSISVRHTKNRILEHDAWISDSS